MLLEFIGGLILAAVLSHLFLNLIKLSDWLMDYGSYFWKLRFNYVFRNSKFSIKRFLLTQLEISKESDDPVAVMHQAYTVAYKENWIIKRWICVMCMAIYLSLFFNIFISIILLNFGTYIIPVYILSFYAYLWAFEKNIKS